MHELRYLTGYGDKLTAQVRQIAGEKRLGELLLKKYPVAHGIKTDKALYNYTVALKNQFLRRANPLSRVAFDEKISMVNHALGLHTFISRVQGGRLKAKNEIRVSMIFKTAPLELLRMIVVHELAHLREKDHNKGFYSLCEHMEPDYHQLEFDLRLYLTHLDLFGPLY